MRLKSASKRPPEPYKGKGIKYADEVIRRKEGKTGAKQEVKEGVPTHGFKERLDSKQASQTP